MKKTITTAAIALALLLSGCTNKNDAKRALTAQGFTNIEYTGYSFLACSKDDTYHTGFKATNSVGARIEGTVCSGFLFKNATIRY